MLLLRGATKPAAVPCGPAGFNTCSSCEEQHAPRRGKLTKKSFNTCSSCEEQLMLRRAQSKSRTFQYMLLLRGATSLAGGHKSDAMFQYMLLLRGATETSTQITIRSGFNTCSSCEEQQAPNRKTALRHTFQYMLLLRGATFAASHECNRRIVSIHAPLARSN